MLPELSIEMCNSLTQHDTRCYHLHLCSNSLVCASFQEMIPGALPVVVFGSDALGWVHKGLCQSFVAPLAAAMYAEALRDNVCSEPDTLFRRVLKQALQHGRSASSLCVNWARLTGLEIVAENLIALENDLPVQVLRSRSFSMWQQWRVRVQKAESAAGLASEVSGCLYGIHYCKQETQGCRGHAYPSRTRNVCPWVFVLFNVALIRLCHQNPMAMEPWFCTLCCESGDCAVLAPFQSHVTFLIDVIIGVSID